MKSKIKDLYSKISYAIIPFIIFISLILITYWGVQLLYNHGLIQGSQYHKTALDDKIPLVSEFVYIYFFTFPLGIFLFFYLAYTNKRAFYNLFITVVIAFTISGFIYLFAETYVTRPDFQPQSFTDKFLVHTWGASNINNFPSQHCFMAYSVIIGSLTANAKDRQRKMNVGFIIFAVICSILICLSTVFTKQHYCMDMVASFVIMFTIYPIISVFKVGDKMKVWQEKREKKRLEKKLNKIAEK